MRTAPNWLALLQATERIDYEHAGRVLAVRRANQRHTSELITECRGCLDCNCNGCGSTDALTVDGAGVPLRVNTQQSLLRRPATRLVDSFLDLIDRNGARIVVLFVAVVLGLWAGLTWGPR